RQGAAVDCQQAERAFVVDGGALRSNVTGQDAVVDRQRAGAPDAATDPRVEGRAVGVTVADCQATQGGNRLGRLTQVEHPGGVVAADRQLTGAEPVDGDVVLDEQLAAGQPDGLPGQGWGEGDRVAVVGGGNRSPQRAGAAVGCCLDCQRAGDPARFQPF